MRLLQKLYDTLRGGPDGAPPLPADRADGFVPVPLRTRMGTPADVAILLDSRAQDQGRGAAWRNSLTELLVLLVLEDTWPQRVGLAADLNLDLAALSPDEIDPALHAALLQRLATNDGIAPQDFYK